MTSTHSSEIQRAQEPDNEGFGIVGRPCTFEFVKQQTPTETGEH
jgi:hypothetical protein